VPVESRAWELGPVRRGPAPVRPTPSWARGGLPYRGFEPAPLRCRL